MSKVTFKAAIDAVSHFSELKRGLRGAGYVETGKLYRLRLRRIDLIQRLRFLLQMSCENERVLAVRFSDGPESKALNMSYRGKASPTDVLSFSAFAQNIELAKMGVLAQNDFSLGDLVVCVPVCHLQAKEQRVSISSEMERMIVHGICHLKGFDHERSDLALTVMEGLESHMRRALVRRFGKPCWAQISEST